MLTRSTHRSRLYVGGAALVLVSLLLATTSLRGDSSPSGAATTTTTYVRAQPGWTVASRSARGVMVDFRNIDQGGAIFRVVRLRARTTLLRWHVGAGDPNAWRLAPADAGASIDWSSEGPPGVVAVFNGAFKQIARGGGAVADHVVFESLVRGFATIALDRFGHWEMGVWGAPNFPTPGFHPISYRQNLLELVQNGKIPPAVFSANVRSWGAMLTSSPYTARTGLGIDRVGNLIYVATMKGVLPSQLADVLVQAGAITAMQLDINPYWPIVGLATTPIHRPGGSFPVQLPGADHSASIFENGWTRDFFVAVAEPGSWSCSWQSPGVKAALPGAQPQPLRLTGKNCATG